MSGQLAAFSRFGTLCHLDLDLVGVDQVFVGYSETGGGDLFDRRAQAVTFLERQVALDAPFADDV